MMDISTYTAIIRSLDNKSLELLGIALALYYTSTLIYALRWKIVLAGMGRDLPLLDLLKVTLSSIFVNNVTPMSRGGGEILRVTWVSKKHQIPIALSTISIVYERIVEIVPVMFLLLLGITYFAAQVLSIAALFMLFILLIWLKWEEFIRISVKILKIQLTQEELLKISELKRKPSLNILAVGLSSMVWILDIARLKLIALAFGWDPNIGLLALISLANLLFGLMAFTPGGVGIVEGGLFGTLTYFGIPSTLAISVTLIERFISYVLSTIVGFLVLIGSGGVELWKALKSH
ncbi:lysylphosphatidylglycerol synthase transmembrane domain-containing protein [Thermococcus celer]|uniref:TIGR00374 family protein n=1 Tax=Thermococcus celer Vu 13 = JCM 8558 TaxID=1293037 RepID=A0A218P254_THECE|nr:lysylphosphatidylglycerol synthase transmembrane domain-containing protein [Thermococcus celer]ASI99016.1 hypothetical protein A3L02_05275 [Thermococcus celer Vu 13 = JCM 8558]